MASGSKTAPGSSSSSDVKMKQKSVMKASGSRSRISAAMKLAIQESLKKNRINGGFRERNKIKCDHCERGFPNTNSWAAHQKAHKKEREVMYKRLEDTRPGASATEPPLLDSSAPEPLRLGACASESEPPRFPCKSYLKNFYAKPSVAGSSCHQSLLAVRKESMIEKPTPSLWTAAGYWFRSGWPSQAALATPPHQFDDELSPNGVFQAPRAVAGSGYRSSSQGFKVHGSVCNSRHPDDTPAATYKSTPRNRSISGLGPASPGVQENLCCPNKIPAASKNLPWTENWRFCSAANPRAHASNETINKTPDEKEKKKWGLDLTLSL